MLINCYHHWIHINLPWRKHAPVVEIGNLYVNHVIIPFVKRQMDSTVKYERNSTLKARFVRKLCIQHTWSLVSTYWQTKKPCPQKEGKEPLVLYKHQQQDSEIDYVAKIRFITCSYLAYHCSLQQSMTSSQHTILVYFRLHKHLFTAEMYNHKEMHQEFHMTFRNNHGWSTVWIYYYSIKVLNFK